MSSVARGNGAVIYEVDLTVDDDIAAEFDDWLAGHVDEMLALPGFVSARIEGVDTDEAGTVRRSVRYRLQSRRALNAYLETHAARMRAHGIDRFGDAMRASRRVLEPAQSVIPVVAEAADVFGECSNCAERLTGQYCYRCGQRDKHRLISLWELLRDLIGDLFEVDSRVWRTAVPLVLRPGFLTIEYLAGRRVHYTPPLRMYLVLSLLFFVVAGIGGDITVDPSAQAEFSLSSDEENDVAGGDRSAAGEEDDAAPVPGGLSAEDRAALRRLSEIDGLEDLAVLGELGAPDATVARGDAEAVTDLADRCENLDTNIQWLKAPAIVERLRRSCERLTAEGGLARFANKVRDNLPTMMFVFLPLIALVMKVLYLGSRRYYVEHLLFFVHFHSFFFLALTVTVLVGMLPDTIPASGIGHGLLIATVSVYSPVYLFRSMRKVYGQWWIVTFLKYLVLLVAYTVSLLVTFLLGVAFTALTV